MKYVLNFLLCFIFGVSLLAQPAEFSFEESNLSGKFLGKAQINQIAAQSGDWIAAFDTDGNCVGANPVVISGGNAYFSLFIFGNDPNTTSIDEGMEEGELFTIRFWDSDLMNLIFYPDNNNPTMFTGWVDTQGEILPDYSDPDQLYEFTNLLNLGCPNIISPSDGALNIQTATLINWFDVLNATGYKISIGDQPGVYNIVDQLDLGVSSSYYVDSLDCATTYFVKLYPYNDVGVQSYCQEESFSTIFATANAGEDVQLCEGESTQLSASGGFIYKWSPSEGLADTLVKSPIATPSISTTYIVTVTHNNGCQDVDTVNVIVLSLPNVNLTISHETSQGANNGAAFSVPTGGSGTYNYLWSNGSTTSSIQNLQPGFHSLTVTDTEGCEASKEFEILAYDCHVFNIFSNITAVSCHDDCDGGVDIQNVTNGIPPYKYIWNTGDTTSSIQEVCSGLYKVTVSDSTNCITIRTYIVNNPEIINSNINNTSETDFNANNGLAFSSPIGGTSPYFYLWSNDDTSQLIDSLVPGHYFLTVTDFNGCQDSSLTTINQFGCDNISISTTITNLSCNNFCDGKIEVDNIFGGVEPYEYLWSNGSINRIINILCPGTYYLTLTDSENCRVFDHYTITEPNALFTNLTTNNEQSLFGDDGSASVDPSGGTSPYFYNWSDGSFDKTIDNLSPGDYSVTIIDSKNCNMIEDFSIEEFICPIFDVNKSISLISCNGYCDGAIDFNPIGGAEPYNYFWNNGSTDREHIDLCPGMFIVTITDNSGCQMIDTTVLDEDVVLEVTIATQNELTQDSHDGSIIPTASGGLSPYHYMWSNGDSTTLLINLIPGTYGLTLTDSRGCQFIDNNITIDAFQCFDMSINYITEDLTCYNECVGVISVTNISDGTFPFEYNWSNGATTNSLTNLCGGTYSLTLTDANDCTLLHSFEIEEPSPYQITFSIANETNTGDANGFAHAIITGGTEPYDIEWNTGSTIRNIDNLSAGVYVLTVTDANDCVLIDTAEILALNCKLLTLSADISDNTCYDMNDAFINILVENANEPYDITWSNGASDNVITQLPSGSYSVSILDNLGCTYTESFIISSPEEIEITIDNIQHITDSTHLGQIHISVIGGNGPYEYLWTSDEYSADTSDIFELEVGCYHLELKDMNGCLKELDACIADLTTSVEDISFDQKIIVFPNPTNGSLNISVDEAILDHYEGKVSNIAGKKLFNFDSNNSETNINLSKLNEGLYFLELKFKERTVYRKIYVQK